jgi:predicted nucleic acid-binding protein
MKSKVYLETTIVSYLVATPTHDIIQSAHQQVTREWWTRRDRFDLFVSRPVLAEARRGDAAAAARRLETVKDIPVLSVSRDVATLANILLRTGTLPPKARLDAIHAAIAAVHGMDYLLTWNLRHLANAAIRGKIEETCRKAGIMPPIICTPEELMEA